MGLASSDENDLLAPVDSLRAVEPAAAVAPQS